MAKTRTSISIEGCNCGQDKHTNIQDDYKDFQEACLGVMTGFFNMAASHASELDRTNLRVVVHFTEVPDVTKDQTGSTGESAPGDSYSN